MPTSLFSHTPTPTTEIYTLSLHDALPICRSNRRAHATPFVFRADDRLRCGGERPKSTAALPTRRWILGVHHRSEDDHQREKRKESHAPSYLNDRSEERRVGKECRSRWWVLVCEKIGW